MQNSLKLNLGAGPRRLEGYVSVDIDPKDADIVADVRDLHMIESNSADEIIAIHVIEHFYKWEVQPMLMEWRRVLKPKGKIILECPNLDFVCKAVLNGQADNLGMWGLAGVATACFRGAWCFLLGGGTMHAPPVSRAGCAPADRRDRRTARSARL